MSNDQSRAAIAAEADKLVGEEFSSITIQIDHLVTERRSDGHSVVATVWSTESAHESLMSQLDYFHDVQLLRDPANARRTVALLDEAGLFVYQINERQTNVIVDAAVWTDTIKSDLLGGTVMNTIGSFIALAHDLVKTAREAGEPSRILAYVHQGATSKDAA